jgi:hypothetical protein
MEYGYVSNSIYNKESGLYDVTIKNKENEIIEPCYRILNETYLKYNKLNGYFLLSPDSKYIFIKETSEPNEILKNIIYSKKHITQNNEDILNMNNDPIERYSSLSFISIPPETCINLALEDNAKDRHYQIVNKTKYNKYDCLVSDIANNSFTNIVPKKKSVIESLSSYFIGTPSEDYDHDHKENKDCNCNVTVEDIHQYNQFYMYGLTSLNLLMIIVIIIIVFVIIQDSENISKHKKTLEILKNN